MKAVLCAAVMLCIGAMASVDMNKCRKTPEEKNTAKNKPNLRRAIEQYLKVKLEDRDTIKSFVVIYGVYHSDKVTNILFVDKLQKGVAITFADDHRNPQVASINSEEYNKYLKCKDLADEDNEES